MEKMKTAYLLLEDGTVYRGYSMGETGSAVGEVVFNTDMTTYQDLLMDPTYSGQIVVQTYPLIGNRGVDPVSETRLMASGYIVREWCVEPTDAHEFITLDAFLRQQHIVGLCGIDTRALTRHIRNHGVMNGVITDSLDNRESWIEQAKNYRVPPAVGKISVAAPVRYEAENARYELAVPDYGFRRSLLEFLLQRGCSCTVYPAYTPAQELLATHPDGILLSDGPGDPWDNPEIVEIIKTLVSSDTPVFGWGLGHQLMAVAAGGTIVKLPVGHRGSNQPVRDARQTAASWSRNRITAIPWRRGACRRKGQMLSCAMSTTAPWRASAIWITRFLPSSSSRRTATATRTPLGYSTSGVRLMEEP